jgi:hypothetical protein
MNIFIIGSSGSGKSTLAKELSENFGYQIIEASEDLRKENPRLPGESDQELTIRLTGISKGILKKDFGYFCDRISEKMQQGTSIVVGIRNPFDFCNLFNPNRDMAINIFSLDKEITDFEFHGLIAIQRTINFYETSMGDKISESIQRMDSLGVKENIKRTKLIESINERSNSIRNKM